MEPTDEVALLSSNGSINYKSIQPVTIGFLQQNTIGKDSATKLPCGDYIALQNPHYYATAEEMYSKLEKSVTYDYARPVGYSEVSVSIEESYLDPGHSKADIYACFDRKKFHIIKNKDVRCVFASVIYMGSVCMYIISMNILYRFLNLCVFCHCHYLMN